MKHATFGVSLQHNLFLDFPVNYMYDNNAYIEFFIM